MGVPRETDRHKRDREAEELVGHQIEEAARFSFQEGDGGRPRRLGRLGIVTDRPELVLSALR
jgi:hypothetical protein